jgi:hypothetical protein
MIKDIIIRERVIRRELVLLGMLFLTANLTNVYAIVVHEGQWSELLSQFHVAGILTLVLYGVSLLLRAMYWGGKRVLVRK